MNQMKKITAAALSVTLALSLAACGAKNDAPEPEQDSEQEQQESSIDYTGDYADSISQRATMRIVQEGETLSFEVDWSSSAFETSVWTMSGVLSEDGTRVDYTDGKLVTTSYGEPGTEPGEEATPVDELVVYENGTGYFEIADSAFTWTSDNDDFAENPVFELIPQ